MRIAIVDDLAAERTCGSFFWSRSTGVTGSFRENLTINSVYLLLFTGRDIPNRKFRMRQQ